jgi:hypothetical protein
VESDLGLGESTMNQDEISARLIVLETFAMMALGLYLANSRNDPDYSKSEALLEDLRQASVANAAAAGSSVQTVAKQYANHLASILADNIRHLRGEGGQSH